jgi:hypothetical protein
LAGRLGRKSQSSKREEGKPEFWLPGIFSSDTPWSLGLIAKNFGLIKATRNTLKSAEKTGDAKKDLLDFFWRIREFW